MPSQLMREAAVHAPAQQDEGQAAMPDEHGSPMDALAPEQRARVELHLRIGVEALVQSPRYLAWWARLRGEYGPAKLADRVDRFRPEPHLPQDPLDAELWAMWKIPPHGLVPLLDPSRSRTLDLGALWARTDILRRLAAEFGFTVHGPGHVTQLPEGVEHGETIVRNPKGKSQRVTVDVDLALPEGDLELGLAFTRLAVGVPKHTRRPEQEITWDQVDGWKDAFFAHAMRESQGWTYEELALHLWPDRPECALEANTKQAMRLYKKAAEVVARADAQVAAAMALLAGIRASLEAPPPAPPA